MSKVFFSSSFTLFNLQGTVSFGGVHLMSAANFYILAQLLSFVKNFFQILSNFFKLSSRSRSARSSRNFYILAELPSFVKNFFKFFQISFVSAFVCCRSPDSFDILPPLPAFVKHFSKRIFKNKHMFITIHF